MFPMDAKTFQKKIVPGAKKYFVVESICATIITPVLCIQDTSPAVNPLISVTHAI